VVDELEIPENLPVRVAVEDLEFQSEALLAPSLDLESLYFEKSQPILAKVQLIGCPNKESVANDLFATLIQNESGNTQMILNDMFEQRNTFC
jgi:hypothetical protein